MRQAGYGKRQRKGRWVIPPEGVRVVGEDEKGREIAGQCKKQGGLGILAGLVRECTTGFSGWLPGVNG